MKNYKIQRNKTLDKYRIVVQEDDGPWEQYRYVSISIVVPAIFENYDEAKLMYIKLVREERDVVHSADAYWEDAD